MIRKLERDPELFLLALSEREIVGTVMGSYDGRRGWMGRLAVAPSQRGLGLARLLVDELERRLRAIGSDKVNLLMTTGRGFGFGAAIARLSGAPSQMRSPRACGAASCQPISRPGAFLLARKGASPSGSAPMFSTLIPGASVRFAISRISSSSRKPGDKAPPRRSSMSSPRLVDVMTGGGSIGTRARTIPRARSTIGSRKRPAMSATRSIFDSNQHSARLFPLIVMETASPGGPLVRAHPNPPPTSRGREKVRKASYSLPRPSGAGLGWGHTRVRRLRRRGAACRGSHG